MAFKIFPKHPQHGVYMPPTPQVEPCIQADGPDDEGEVLSDEALQAQVARDSENKAKAKLYEHALKQLYMEHRKYESNYRMFVRWELNHRIWWIDQIEKQAQAGHKTIGVDVVLKVVELRIMGNFTDNPGETEW